jgi:hypothetical protein
MTKDEIQAILERVHTWPADKQRLALDLLMWIEARDQQDDYELTDEDWADLEEGLVEADRGEFVPEEEMKAFFAKYR